MMPQNNKKEINELGSKLYTISHDPEVKEVYRKWAEQARRFIYGEFND